MFRYTQETVSDQIIMEFAKTAELFGLTTLEARLFAYMYLEDRPLTLDEMSEAIGKSRTSMSNGVRGLLDLKLVTRVWKKGERKDLYQAASPCLIYSWMLIYKNGSVLRKTRKKP
ncbi:putative HTH-type transcriptional regulator [Lentibacillus sp. JNUCC-1]|uniref:GbsR/MarR family transcriptional regulator n=1 Tax=Lentibacillus sp. JNUCC-1 TaxID=2654513 RepID=UPI001327AABA|nr:helix-turn-helix domain-containing protein [Lentibacillus sp. JNUCC-1]MUV36597.1 putative HTH-type transcriptional regulator [Lentibacillus sp. JNUCC-1]